MKSEGRNPKGERRPKSEVRRPKEGRRPKVRGTEDRISLAVVEVEGGIRQLEELRTDCNEAAAKANITLAIRHLEDAQCRLQRAWAQENEDE